MGYFTDKLSNDAVGAAQPWNGYPPFHFVGGNIDEPTVPVSDLAEAMDKVLRSQGNSMAKYGMNSGPQGYLPLREFIADNLKQRNEMVVDPSEILVTTGSLQAMDLVNFTLLNKGDVVLLEDANYAGALTRLDALGVEYVGIKLDSGGMRMDHLRETLQALAAKAVKPKYIYTIPTVQNPTATVMSKERRLEMLALSKEFDVPIFEDDCYADLTWSGTRPPAIHALDKDRQVIYCGTYSKTVAPALRVGYLIAPWEFLRHVLPLKTDAGSGALEQMMLAEYLPNHFDAHVTDLLPMLKRKSDTMIEALNEHFGASAEFTEPAGGIYIWVNLPDQVNTDRLAVVAGQSGVEINPGSQWTVYGDQNRNKMRLCFGHPSEENIREGIAKLAEICHREFGIPLRSGNIER